MLNESDAAANGVEVAQPDNLTRSTLSNTNAGNSTGITPAVLAPKNDLQALDNYPELPTAEKIEVLEEVLSNLTKSLSRTQI